ncbi:hypothetical protein B0H13DRAFT_1867040 [Mycena leptocephala]|nr:hypothetical protein B0H13DRAFT_1867040 [Mycena leptocephala]
MPGDFANETPNVRAHCCGGPTASGRAIQKAANRFALLSPWPEQAASKEATTDSGGPIHSGFLLASWSIAMVYRAQPELSGYEALVRAAVYVPLCFGVKSLIMTIDDLLDYDIDALVERTRNRPLPRGAISLGRAWIFFGMQVVLGVYLAVTTLSSHRNSGINWRMGGGKLPQSADLSFPLSSNWVTLPLPCLLFTPDHVFNSGPDVCNCPILFNSWTTPGAVAPVDMVPW